MGLASKALNSATALDRLDRVTCSNHALLRRTSHLIAKRRWIVCETVKKSCLVALWTTYWPSNTCVTRPNTSCVKSVAAGCPGLWRPHARSNLFKMNSFVQICLNSFEHHTLNMADTGYPAMSDVRIQKKNKPKPWWCLVLTQSIRPPELLCSPLGLNDDYENYENPHGLSWIGRFPEAMYK